MVSAQITGRTAREVAASVEQAVRQGTLGPGDRLPTVRGLAGSLGVANGTVAAAYRDLAARGLVETDGRRGTRVRPAPPVRPRSAAALPLPPDAVDLSGSGPDPALLPRLGPALRRLGPGPAVAPPVLPLPRLLELGRERLAADGVPADALTVASGALDGVERVLAAVLRRGDRVAVEDPGTPALLDLLAALGLAVVPVPLDAAGPRPEGLAAALRGGARGAVLTPRGQDPTGAAVDAGRREQLRDVLAPARDVLVVEHDPVGELAGAPLLPLAGATTSWALVQPVSAVLGPGLSVALVAGDETTVARVEGRLRLAAGGVSGLLQALVVALWEDPDVGEQVAAAGRAYASRRSGLLAALGKRSVPATGRTGLQVWVPTEDETTAVARLLGQGWLVAAGARCRLRSAPGLRVGLAGLGGADLGRLADDLRDAVGA